MDIEANKITAVIGPSGCGKSTFIRCLNRLHEVMPGARAAGEVWLGDIQIYDRGVDPAVIRRRVGMVFQRPNPLPTMSIFDNVAIGVRLKGLEPGESLKEIVKESLRQAGLLEEVAGRLHQPGAWLSGGQQQRLCLARALAVKPEVLLLDEPCSALDPASTLRIESLLRDLSREYTIVIVTHNMQQAARVSDNTAFLYEGELVEYAPTSELFTNPRSRRTEDYITGRFS
ncbi:MAG: phosphate transport system ATP-binding protein [Clostridia bacterium]|nr:phosphate transport system ATP-binding protein [Clostridia bacterium]